MSDHVMIGLFIVGFSSCYVFELHIHCRCASFMCKDLCKPLQNLTVEHDAYTLSSHSHTVHRCRVLQGVLDEADGGETPQRLATQVCAPPADSYAITTNAT